VAKKNYTKAGAKRALISMGAKLSRLQMDGYISAKQFISLDESMRRIYNRIK
jgi:hypothetical protein